MRVKFTNRCNFPDYLYDWLKSSSYDYNSDPHTISTTTMMKPIRALLLPSRHDEEVEVDVSTLIAARLGDSVHDSIESTRSEGVSKEKRISRKINILGTEYTVTGKYDVLVKDGDEWELRDIKTTSVWSFVYGGKDDSYQKQLSIYRWLLSDTHNIKPISSIDFFFTDWQSSKAKQDESYPQQRLHTSYEVKLLSLEETETYIRERLRLIHINQEVPDDQLPLCTQEELWCTDEKFAVTKYHAKRATKLCTTREEAEKYMTTRKIKGYIDHRQAKARRCSYCSAAALNCNQYQQLVQQGLIN